MFTKLLFTISIVWSLSVALTFGEMAKVKRKNCPVAIYDVAYGRYLNPVSYLQARPLHPPSGTGAQNGFGELSYRVRVSKSAPKRTVPSTLEERIDVIVYRHSTRSALRFYIASRLIDRSPEYQGASGQDTKSLGAG